MMKHICKFFFATLISIFFLTTAISSNAQDKGKVLARIYTGFYHNFDNTLDRQTGFDFTTGIIGYSRKLGENVKATLLYDVTRTTNFSGMDTLAGSFEGSKYTAFLKMGQIDWQFHPRLALSVGQLLNQQYLTVQDKWWGFRYVCVTYQEKYRYGMPADFGARFTYSSESNNLRWSLSAVNGEGPFRYQDNNSIFLISTNIEYVPKENFLIKVYTDYEKPSDETFDNFDKNVVSVFLGHKSKKLMLGCELNYVTNYNYVKDMDYKGASLYTSYAIWEKFKVLARLDYGNLKSEENDYYSIIGFQYEPAKNYFTSVNLRLYRYEPDEFHDQQINVNFGAKF
ncbi:MAG: hypothetical protein U9R19_10885 [Bacteroidota bacterium]|nr:hypothetical protein [Bacteroidota bacterium]